MMSFSQNTEEGHNAIQQFHKTSTFLFHQFFEFSDFCFGSVDAVGILLLFV